MNRKPVARHANAFAGSAGMAGNGSKKAPQNRPKKTPVFAPSAL
jgi:hypothetical protein